MTIAKIKTPKAHNYYNDGKWTTNGKWMAARGYIRPSLSDIRALIDSGIPFTWRLGSLDTSDGHKMPEYEQILDNARKATHEAARLNVAWVDPEGHLVRFVGLPDGTMVAISSDYWPMIELADEVKGTDDKSPLYCYRNGDLQAVVMPLAHACGDKAPSTADWLRKQVTVPTATGEIGDLREMLQAVRADKDNLAAEVIRLKRS